LSQRRRPRVLSCVAVAVLFPLTARAGEQAPAANETDAPVVVTPADAEASTLPQVSPSIPREGEQAPATGEDGAGTSTVNMGRTVVREDGKPVGKGRRFVISPATAPDGTGVGAAVSVLF